jgi:response regulator RpfG family c-di-GMP phosphodiesterase/serine/threonine protein kinase
MPEFLMMTANQRRPASVTRYVESGDVLALLDYCVQRSLIHREDWQNTPEDIRAELEQETDSHRLLANLVKVKLLTQYQADRIEAGTMHGMLLSSYRILDRLGAGGMGVVFLGEHIHLRRLVAIKMLPLYAGIDASSPMLTRFFNEIRTIAQLQHPNIVWALDTGEIPGEGPEAPVVYYHVMEYVPGKDLEQLVQTSGPLSSTLACDLTYQIASALVEAEKRKLVHRDIKPSNILVTPEGQAKLLDFGLARSADNRHTQQGMVLGTIDYLAPEQARDSSAVDIRADVYSLGGTLFWALTGRVPFPSDASLQHQIIARFVQQPPLVCQVNRSVPHELDTIIVRMMATNPDDRYQTPQAVMRALLPFLRSQSGEVTYLAQRETNVAEGIRVKTASSESGVHTPANNRVLIVDDEQMMRAIARHALQAEGYECGEAADGKQAIDMIRTSRYDLVLLDVEIPKVRGDDVLRRLRDEPPSPHLKVIMASGRATVEEMSNMLLAGADDFLAKPFSIMQLVARVKSALRLKDAQDHSDSLAKSLLALNHQLESNLRSRDVDLIDARNALTLAIAELVAYRGVETSAHLHRIQQFVRVLAKEASANPAFSQILDQNYIQMLEGTAPLHDVGMIGLPEYIFLKPGKLTDDERVLMRTHTTIGADILQKIARSHGFAATFLQMAIDITRHHHERWDGRGYPDHLRDQNIPLAARIVSIADVYDALRSRRPHKPALSHAATVEVMTESSQGQFDPTLLNAFKKCADGFDQIFRAHPD